MKDRQYADVPTLDLVTANNPWYSTGYAVYNSLVQFEPGYLKPTESNIAADFAESWETSADGLQITFRLRQSVKFHNKPPVNGRVVDMDDVLFSWDRFASKYSGRTSVVNAANPNAPVLSVAGADQRTLVMKLKEPLVYTLGLLVGSNGTGPYVIPKETETTLDLRGDMLGTGPWYLENYTPSVSFTLKRNPDFWDKDYALVEQIDLPVIPEYVAALAQLKAGNLYYRAGSHSSVGNIAQDDILPLKRDEPRILLYQSDVGVGGSPTTGRRLAFGWLPEGKSPFLDERVRQAIVMSWDRELHIEAFHNIPTFRSEGLPVETRWNTALPAVQDGWWLNPQGKDFGPNAKYFQHNPSEAKKLLAAAGYPNGFETISNYVTTQELGNTPAHAEVIDGFAREIGINTRVKSLDYLKEYTANYRDGRGQFEGWSYVSTAGGATGGSAIGTLAGEYWSKGGAAFKGFSVSGQNDQSGDPQVDALIEKGRLELDTEKQRAIVFDLQRYLAKPWYTALLSGVASGFEPAWPCVGNFRVWQGGRPHYGLWVDTTKPPFQNS
jgi:peptide/nickel transport system substrate-binding protein